MKKLFLSLSLLVGMATLSSFTTNNNSVEKLEKAYLVTITNSCGMTNTFGVTDGSFYDVACYWEELCD